MRNNDLTKFEPRINHSDEQYTPYKRYEITVKNVWMYGNQMCICSEKGQGFGIAKTLLFTESEYDWFKSMIGKTVNVWAMMKIADKREKYIALPSHYE